MPEESNNQTSVTAAVESAALALKQAYAKHGPQHLEVLNKIELYIAALRQAGRIADADRYEEGARALRETLGAAGSVASQQSARANDERLRTAPSVSAAEGSRKESPERHLYNSKGRHIATEHHGLIYTPEGRFAGRWSEELGVFLDKHGWYLGDIIEDNRLARYALWEYRQVNFGTRGSESDRPGWDRQRDVRPIVLPKDYEDVEV
ncbi:MAG TPA: hypothetical protein V6D08_21220 [Candidatus Obscuribacterales bacterium]